MNLAFMRPQERIVFIRSGKINSWKKILTKDQIKKVEDAFHKNMKELGYIK